MGFYWVYNRFLQRYFFPGSRAFSCKDGILNLGFMLTNLERSSGGEIMKSWNWTSFASDVATSILSKEMFII